MKKKINHEFFGKQKDSYCRFYNNNTFFIYKTLLKKLNHLLEKYGKPGRKK